jgi:hypothetical protein
LTPFSTLTPKNVDLKAVNNDIIDLGGHYVYNRQNGTIYRLSHGYMVPTNNVPMSVFNQFKISPEIVSAN